jgi:hypothetical protein
VFSGSRIVSFECTGLHDEGYRGISGSVIANASGRGEETKEERSKEIKLALVKTGCPEK